MVKNFFCKRSIHIALGFIAVLLANSCGVNDADEAGDADSGRQGNPDDDSGESRIGGPVKAEAIRPAAPEFTLPTLDVKVAAPPEGNPLARKLIVRSNMPCSLTARIYTEGEPGFGISTPEVTDAGGRHTIWFFGLLPERIFEYRIYSTEAPDVLLAAGTFKTPALPFWTPEPINVVNKPEASKEMWAALLINSVEYQQDVPFFDKLGLLIILDRKGRIRFFHNSPETPDQLNSPMFEGLLVLENADLAWSNRNDVMAVKPDGTEYVLFDVQLKQPHFIPTHHHAFIFEDDPMSAIVLFNQKGPGLKCDLETPTQEVIYDGAAFIDGQGREMRRWAVADHLEELPPDLLDPCGCGWGFWGMGTYDFSHANSVYPTDDAGAFLMSFRNLSRVIKVDAGSGEIIWQMGKDLDFVWIGDEPQEDRWFFKQHDAQMLPGNRLLLYDNGYDRHGRCEFSPWSRALELEVDESAMTVRLAWEHRVPFAPAMGNVVRLENGNTFIAGGTNRMVFEATPEGNEIWSVRYSNAFFIPNIATAMPCPALWRYE